MTGTNTFTNADLVAVIEEYWVPMGLEQFFAAPVLANHLRDLSAFQSEGNDIFHVPDIFTNNFTVSSQSTQGTEVSLQSPTQVDVTLTVNTHNYIAYIIDDLARAQIGKTYMGAGFDISQAYVRKAVKTLVNDLEGDLAALWSSITTNVIGDTASVVTDAEVRQAIEALASADMILSLPTDEFAWFWHPYVLFNQLLAIQKYYDQSQFSNKVAGVTYVGNFTGSGETPAPGRMGQLYGIPMFMTSNIVSGLQTYRNMLLHRDTIAFAVQTPNMVRTRAAEWLANMGVLTVHDIIQGTGILREDLGVVVNANSAFVAS